MEAFRQFRSQCKEVIDKPGASDFKLAGEARRFDAGLATEAIFKMAREVGLVTSREKITEVMNEFPGVGRRFEKITDKVYTDYAHHPEEITATMGVVLEEAKMIGAKGVVVVYQPHQNTRQHEVRKGYKKAFLGAEKVFWLPTYLTRENPELPVLTQKDFIRDLENREVAEAVEMGAELGEKLREYIEKGYLVILMSAGPADEWFREQFSQRF